MRVGAVLLICTALLAGCGSSHGSAGVRAAPPSLAKRLLKQRLDAQQLAYSWVACVAVGRTYRQVEITRCNVDYGIDPHVEAYCLVLKNGELTTNHEHPQIPCKHDDAGWDQTTITSG